MLLYVAVVLTVDTLAANRTAWPLNWGILSWHLGNILPATHGGFLARFDLFKFVFWLLIPVCACLRSMDWTYLLRGPWKRPDLLFLAAIAAAGMAAMFLIPLVPALREFYPPRSDLPLEVRFHFFAIQLVWTLSWVVGWEFLHRYALLRAVQREPLDGWLPGWRWTQWGWLLVALAETLYHLQKAWLEAAGMFALSLVLTWWCLRRRNWLLALVVHLIIEVELLLFLTFFG